MSLHMSGVDGKLVVNRKYFIKFYIRLTNMKVNTTVILAV